ncbi:MAG: hypothetical protein LBF26_00565 [Puniceicoccales bacterium]|jgi:phage/plasmid-associated DNA primase|nr:hypothetical protein [Puniceicoccales bacterium]
MNNHSEPSRVYQHPAENANISSKDDLLQTNTSTVIGNSKATIDPAERLKNSAMQLVGAMREDAKNCGCTPSFMAYYDNKNKEFLVRNNQGIWIRQNDSQLSLHLKNARFGVDRTRNELLSAFEKEKLRIIKECGVEYAGPLAGYREGFYGEKGWLITQSPNLFFPESGKWDTLNSVLAAIFEDNFRQLDYIHGWLKISLEALYAGRYFPRQALVFAGERGCGKSLFQNIITALLGGRCAKPYASMSGEKFNGELFGAEHLMIEDEVPHVDMRARKAFGNKIKQFTSSEMQRCNCKHREAVMLSPRWHLTISLNDEPEDLGVLPPIDSGIADKIMLFKAHKRPFPMSTETLEERERFKKCL